MSARLTFSGNAIFDNAGVTVANLSAAGLITGSGTWWGVAGQPADVTGSFTADVAEAPAALAIDASDLSYGFLLTSAVIAPSADLPLFWILSTDPSDAPSAISFDFEGSSSGGSVTAVHSDQASEGNLSFGSHPNVVDIQFTGTFTGDAEICIEYDPAHFTLDANIGLYHYVDGAWHDVTCSIDVVGHRVCGDARSLSPFAAGEVTADEELPPTNRDATPWAIALLLLASVTAAAGIQLRRRGPRR
jgi:hypothetical protein